MSAYLVPKQHIDVLVEAAMRVPPFSFFTGLQWSGRNQNTEIAIFSLKVRDLLTAHEVGRRLWLANLAGVQTRYPQATDGEWPGPAGLTFAEIQAYRFMTPVVSLPAVAILKAIHGYEYQCLADPSWRGSYAEGFCRALERRMIQSLPGYTEATWEIDEETLDRKREG